MDKKEQLTEASSNVAHTNWTEHKESTSPFGIKLILLMYRIGGKFLVYPILYIIVLGGFYDRGAIYGLTSC